MAGTVTIFTASIGSGHDVASRRRCASGARTPALVAVARDRPQLAHALVHALAG